jgi:hypothetical protein
VYHSLHERKVVNIDHWPRDRSSRSESGASARTSESAGTSDPELEPDELVDEVKASEVKLASACQALLDPIRRVIRYASLEVAAGRSYGDVEACDRQLWELYAHLYPPREDDEDMYIDEEIPQ